MRILHIARYGSTRGGAETYLRSLCEQQRATGHAVALAYGLEPDPSRPEVREGFQVGGLVEPGPEAAPAYEKAILEVIDRFAPDVVHVHCPDISWVAPLAATRAPVLLAVHDHVLHCPTGTKYWTYWQRPCGVRPGAWCLGFNAVAGCGSTRANLTLKPYRRWRAARDEARPLHIQVFSEAMRVLVAGAGIEGKRFESSRIEASRIEVTPYPAPPMPEPAAPSDRDERPVIFASGRLNKEKGFHLFLRSLYSVGLPVHAVIAGEGHGREALEKEAVNGPKGSRVTFTGWLSPAAMAGWYERAAVVAVPSAWVEPFGIAGLEAMTLARPVVAFDVGGVREWLDDGVTGVLVKRMDTAAFGRAIRSLLDDDEKRVQMGQAGRRRVAEEFSFVSHSERLAALYDKVRRDRGRTA